MISRPGAGPFVSIGAGLRATMEAWHCSRAVAVTTASSWMLLTFHKVAVRVTFEAVSRDFHDWGRHVRPGGVILLHDSQQSPAKAVPTSCGPYRLVHEVLPYETGFRVARAVDSTTVVIRT